MPLAAFRFSPRTKRERKVKTAISLLSRVQERTRTSLTKNCLDKFERVQMHLDEGASEAQCNFARRLLQNGDNRVATLACLLSLPLKSTQTRMYARRCANTSVQSQCACARAMPETKPESERFWQSAVRGMDNCFAWNIFCGVL